MQKGKFCVFALTKSADLKLSSSFGTWERALNGPFVPSSRGIEPT